MYTLRNVENHNHILAASNDLTEIMAIKLYNELRFQVKSAIYDDIDDMVSSKEIARYMYHLELNRRVDTYSTILDRSIDSSAASNGSNGALALPALAEFTIDHNERIEFSTLFVLPHKATILVPSTYNVNLPAPKSMIDQAILFVAKALADQFGGANIEVDREGIFIDSNGQVVSEKCTPVNVRMVERNDDTDQYLARIAASVRRTMLQESVYLEIDDKVYFV